MKDLLKRVRFTRHDLLNIIRDPKGSAKAYAAAVTAIVVRYLATKGVDVPDEIALSLGAVIGWVFTAALGFAVAWLTPTGETYPL